MSVLELNNRSKSPPIPKPRKVFMNNSEKKLSTEFTPNINKSSPFLKFDDFQREVQSSSLEKTELFLIEKSFLVSFNSDLNTLLETNTCNTSHDGGLLKHTDNSFDEESFQLSKLDDKKEKEKNDENSFKIEQRRNDSPKFPTNDLLDLKRQYYSNDDLIICDNSIYFSNWSFLKSIDSSFNDLDSISNINLTSSDNSFLSSSTPDKSQNRKITKKGSNESKKTLTDNWETRIIGRMLPSENIKNVTEICNTTPFDDKLENFKQPTPMPRRKFLNQTYNLIYDFPILNSTWTSKDSIKNYCNNSSESIYNTADENLKPSNDPFEIDSGSIKNAEIKNTNLLPLNNKNHNNKSESQSRDDSFWIKVCKPKEISESEQFSRIRQFKKNKMKKIKNLKLVLNNKASSSEKTEKAIIILTDPNKRDNSIPPANDKFWDDIFEQYNDEYNEISPTKSGPKDQLTSSNPKSHNELELPPSLPVKLIRQQRIEIENNPPSIPPRIKFLDSYHKNKEQEACERNSPKPTLPVPSPRTKFIPSINNFNSFNDSMNMESEPDIKSFVKTPKNDKYKKLLTKFKLYFKRPTN